ncbi:LAGLIDADG family homing endonuclease [Salinirubrum litoreum]|uniref:DNA helicase n=1 Tax=Salinirubrum litoreum TaxID=1126234 RepID=A0ABD5REN8_9EURY|nr:LAGLIDADG family homing endonuclease [Salinirubrum litoreum]
MATGQNQELTDRFIQFYRNYYREAIGQLAQQYPNEKRSLLVDYDDLYRFDADLAEDYLDQPDQLQEYAEEALRLYDLPADVKLGQAHVRIEHLPSEKNVDIRDIRVHDDHIGKLISVSGIVRKATDVRPKITEAAFECQRCGTMTYIPQSDGNFQEPHECQGCERQGPFRVNFDQSEFVDSQKVRIQESPEGLRGGETPQSIDVNLEDDVTGRVTAGDQVTMVGVLHIEQMGNDREKSPVFDLYMDGVSLRIDDEEFEDMDITDEDKQEIVELSSRDDLYEAMVASVAPSIYGYDQQKLAMILQLFSGVTKHLPDGSRIRGDLHMLLIGDPGTGKSQLLSYIRHIAPRSVYTSGKGTSSAGLTAAAVQDDFGDGQQWTLEAGALVLADKGIAAVDELDKMRCVTGDTLVHTTDGILPIREIAHRASEAGDIERLRNGRTIRGDAPAVWTMDDKGRIVRRDVRAVHEYDAPETLHEVALESGESVTATADHPFFVFEDGERVERPTAELDAGDWVYVPESIREEATDGGTVALDTEPPDVPCDELVEDTVSVGPAKGAILGYIAGDGNVYSDDDGGSHGIRFTNKEEQLLSHFESVCREAYELDPVRHPSEQRDDGVETVRLHGRAVVDDLLNAGLNLETYEGKRVPEGVGRGSRATKAAFVRALADSEGGVGERAIRIASSSYELLLGTKMLCLEFGIRCQIQRRERDDRRDLFVLAITADDSLTTFQREIGFTLDRKSEALARTTDETTGDRAVLDVLPDLGADLGDLRESLRLYQSECGVNATTYCNFENGDANASLHRAERIYQTFRSRREQAREDRTRLDESTGWEVLSELADEYHISQRDLASGTCYSQQRVSELWESDESLRTTAVARIQTILDSVAGTSLSRLGNLVDGDVRWRRVASVESVESTEYTADDGRVPVLKRELAETLGCPREDVSRRAESLLCDEPSAVSWDDLRAELDRHDISLQQVATEMGVAGSTVSRWFSGAVDVGNFTTVRDVSLGLVDDVRSDVSALYEEILARKRDTRVYDLTVEGTHNFVANGMIVHNSEDRSAMHEGLEQQEISISKAGINATLKSRCSLLGAANPKYGRFDQYEPIGEQIDLEPALISRFDLIFTVTDQPDPEKDADLADHIINTNYAGELHTQRTNTTNSNFTQEQVDNVTEDVAPEIEPELLRKYIAYAKRTCYPTMTDEAKQAIRDFYVDLRAKGADEDAPVPVTARKLEAIVRLSEASARVRLSDTVEIEDAERVIEIVRSCLQDIGVDPETGQFDADVVETGRSKTQRDRVKNIRQLINDIEGEYEQGAPVEEVLERAEDVGMDRSKAEHEIEKLRRQGEVYEPSSGHLRTT